MPCRCSRSAMHFPTRTSPSSSSACAGFCGLPPDEKIAFMAEPKIDGLSCTLRYEGGRLVSGATRGDGFEGEDVTANVAHPRRHSQTSLAGKGVPDVCEVRGEVYMSQADFAALNERQEKQRQADFRQPAQRRGGLAAPARSVDHRFAAAAFSSPTAWGEMSRVAGGHPIRHAEVVRSARASRPIR